MTIPLWAITAALTAASAYGADRYASSVDDEQARLRAAEMDRESLRQRERDDYLNALLGDFGREDVEGRTDEAEADRLSRIESTSNAAPSNVDDYVASGSAPVTVKNDIGNIIANYVGKGKEEQKRRARIGAFGDANLEDSINIMRTGDDLGMLDDFTRGGQRVLDTEMTMAPRYAGRNWKTFSDVAGAGAQAVGWYDIFNAANAASTARNTTKLANGKTYTQGPRNAAYGAWGS